MSVPNAPASSVHSDLRRTESPASPATRRAKTEPSPAASLVSTVVVGILLPIGMALLPFVVASLVGRDPYPPVMLWASPEVLPFLGLLGGIVGAVTYWLRGTNRRHKPSVSLRFACGLAVFSLVPIPLVMYRTSMEAAAMMFLAPNFFMAGVAVAWRIAQWFGPRRVVATSLAGALATYWVVGMLSHAPDYYAGLRRAALPVALVAFAVATWRGWRSAPRPID